MQLILSPSNSLRTDTVPLKRGAIASLPRQHHFLSTISQSGRSSISARVINTVSPGQVVPNKWGEGGKDAVRMQRLMHALMQMKKINIAALERAYNGE